MAFVGKKLIYFTSVLVSLGVFCHGYDQGVMSGIITGEEFKEYFGHPSRVEIGTVVAVLEIGALCSALVAGRVGDKIGRRKTIGLGASIFVLGGFVQTISTSLSEMIIGRIISGIGVGFLSTIVPVYQSEISPPKSRGKLAAIEFTGNIIGYCSSVWVDYACSYLHGNISWRLPLLVQCFIGMLLALGSLLVVETPRWLLNHDHDEEGLTVLAKLYSEGDRNSQSAQEHFAEIKETVLLHRLEGKASYAYMWRRYRRRVLIAMSSQAFAQLNGINIISYYAPMVFEQAGWHGRDAILMTGINGIIYVLSTVPVWYLVDRWGRRRILISGGLIMASALLFISYFMFLDLKSTPTLVVVFVVIYNAFFGYSWGPIPWLYPPEILPLSIRAKGSSLSTASNWAFNWLVGEVTPVLQEKMGWALYILPAFFSVCSVVLVYFVYPETKGVTLEEMDSLFGDKTVHSGASYRSLPRNREGSVSNDTHSLLGSADAGPSESEVLDIVKDQAREAARDALLTPSAAARARGNSTSNPEDPPLLSTSFGRTRLQGQNKGPNPDAST